MSERSALKLSSLRGFFLSSQERDNIDIDIHTHTHLLTKPHQVKGGGGG